MKSLLTKAFGTLLFLLICVNISFAQKEKEKPADPDYKNNPVWISMIDNPSTNYYEAIKAYDTYWQYHEKPMGEEEEEGFVNESRKEKEEAEEREKERERRKLNKGEPDKLTPEDIQRMEFRDRMTYQCKRFENWKKEVLPFVQEDGRILTLEQRRSLK